MAEIRWTSSQKEAIYADKGDILVSAAAGSGKTAVLVERVIRKLLDPENPAQIDSFVIITFTKKAAQQMKEKIRKSLMAAGREDPQNEHIKRQLMKLHTAKICTIDSLCLDIVRENFHAVDMDPAFRMASQQETDIIKRAVMEEVLEENYASKKRDGSKEAFIAFVESYIGRDDKKIETLIGQIYRFAQSDAEPYEWMDKSIAVYKSAKTMGSDGEMPALWIYFKEYVLLQLSQLLGMAQEGLEISESFRGPYKYGGFFKTYIDTARRMITELNEGTVIFSRLKEELEEALPKERLPSFTSKYDKENVDMDLKEEAKGLLAACKSLVSKELLENFFSKSMEEHYKDLDRCSYAAETLINITKEFSLRFEQEKKKRAIADFSDISHGALKVLIEHDEEGRMIRDPGGRPVYTKTADLMAKKISEIIVDEYQDTNLLQEYIINALSSERFGRPNVFMVGDMKQSIYRFRFAVPKLFTEKYDSYGGGTDTQRVLLQNNFRSRPEILSFTNFIFSQIMTKQTGEIDYSDGNELIMSPAYKEDPPKDRIVPEIYIVEASAAEGRKCEAYIAAERILKMTGEEEILEDGQMRPVRFGDIAILTSKNEAAEIELELEARKIPHIKSSNTGFFEAFEISLLLNVLKITDNPYQDIPFAAVLRSPLLGFTASDLAVLKAGYDNEPFSLYKAARAYAMGEFSEGSFRLGKIKEMAFFDFMAKLEDYREKSLYLSVSRLIDYVTQDLGFYDIFAAMKGADIRRANINEFYAMAQDYEETGHKGLFDFLRYIANLRKNGYDTALSPACAEGSDAVSIMTIHKSKGLEYPVVFLMNTGNRYYENETKDDIIMDKDLGLGVDVREPQTRVKSPSIAKNIISAKIKREGRAEQMRLLYVALTRAKTKLIITGTAQNADILKKDDFPDDKSINAMEALSCQSHLALIMKALSNGYKNVCSLKILTPDEIIKDRAQEIARSGAKKRRLINMVSEADAEGAKERFEYEYPYADAVKMPVKITASSLEKKNPDPSDEKTERDPLTEEGEASASAFSSKGAARGTAYHRFFEVLDYKEADKGAEYLLKKALGKGLIRQEEAEYISVRKMDAFLKGQLGMRMRKAFKEGLLFREQAFVTGIETNAEMQLVQGIIDAFFEEDGEIVLVDYKTDLKKEEADFISVYTPQLKAYANAIEKALGKRVSHKLIYSVELEKTIEII